MNTMPKLWYRDSRGKLRVWFVEHNLERFRTVAGIEGGELVTSEWTVCEAKNVGKKNHLTPIEQCLKEVEALYEHKLTRKYATSVEALDAKNVSFPMLAAKYEPSKFKWDREGVITCYSQPKLDGIRCLAKLVDGKVTLWSRQGRQHVGFTEIEEELYLFLKAYPDAILDGELYNHQLRNEFNTIVSAVRGGHEDLKGAIQYHVYDVFGGGLTDTAFLERSNFLSKNLHVKSSPVIRLVQTLAVGSQLSLDAIYETYLSQGYEGQIIRLPFEPYAKGKRSESLLKRKEWNDAEFPVVDMLEGTGNWAGKARKVLLKTGTDTTSEADIVGSYEQCKEYWAKWQSGWRPKAATVTYFGPITERGALRFGKARTFWDNGRDL